MPITAKLVTGKTDFGAEPPFLVDSPTGSTGQADYTIVGTNNTDAAFGASGLPAKGDSWSGVFPNLTVQRRILRPVVRHATDVGLHWCRLEYAAPGIANYTTAGFPGLKYTRVNATTIGIQIRADIRLTSANWGTSIATPDTDGETVEEVFDRQIDNGRGTTRDKGVVELEVTRFLNAADVTDALLAKLVQLQDLQLTNSDTVTIPTLVGTTRTWTFTARQLRFNRFAIGGDGAVTRLTYSLLAAYDHDFRWQLTNEFGAPLNGATRQRARLYNTAAFQTSPALW